MADRQTNPGDPLVKQGAEARARGVSMFKNPFYETAAMPAATGEDVQEWTRKAEAWEAGWRLEDAIRGD